MNPVNAVEPLTAEFLIVVTEADRETDSSDVHSEKAKFSMDVTESPVMICLICLHEKNEY